MTSLHSLTQRARGSDFVRHGLLVFTGLMAANVLQFAFYFLLSRAVSIEQYGAFSSLFSAALLLATAPATVAGTIVTRLAADLRATADGAKLRRLGDVVTSATGIVGALCFGVVVAVAAPIATFLHLGSTLPVVITGVLFAFSVALPVQRGVFQGAQRFSAYSLSMIVEAGGKVVVAPLLALRFGIDGALAGLSIACFVAWGYNVVQLRRSARGAARLRLDVRRIGVSSMNVAIAVLAINALLFYDVILVRHYFSAVTAGLFGAAALAARALYMVIAFIPTIVLPKATARRNLGRGARPLLIASLVTASLMVAVALAAAALAPRLIVSIIAGRAYANAGGFVLLYMGALGALALANVVTMYNIGLHRFDFVVPLALIACGEVIAVVSWHPDVHTTLSMLCIGHSLALLATLVRFRVTRRQRQITVPTPG